MCETVNVTTFIVKQIKDSVALTCVSMVNLLRIPKNMSEVQLLLFEHVMVLSW